jgi:ubiquinone/menaquinone biosynthesis C-methylase UbiE
MQKPEDSNITKSHHTFVQNYASSSSSDETMQRFKSVKTNITQLGISKKVFLPESRLKVCDIGCGAATQCALWEEEGHKVFGLDVNAPLLYLAKDRLLKQFGGARLCLGLANELPY